MTRLSIWDRYDRDYTGALYEGELGDIADDYFRVEVVNEERLPVERLGREPVIMIANHSAMGMSWDNIMIDLLIYRALRDRTGSSREALSRKIRRLVDPLLMSDRRTINPFFIREWWVRTGCLAASIENFDDLLAEGWPVFISPEGTEASSKSFSKRYQLQPFSSSFVYMAVKHNALVVPFTIVNAEYTRPGNVRLEWLHRLVRRFGMPMLPVGPAVTQLAFAATYLTPYPVKLVYEVQEPFRFPQLGGREEMRAMAAQVRETLQRQLQASVRRYHHPYDFRGYFGKLRTARDWKMMLPFFWHERFLRTAGYPRWMSALYKIPLGLPLVAAVHAVLGARAQPRLPPSRDQET